MRHSNIEKCFHSARPEAISHPIPRRILLWLILSSSVHCPMAGGEVPLGRSCTLCWVERLVDFSLRHDVEPQIPLFLHGMARHGLR